MSMEYVMPRDVASLDLNGDVVLMERERRREIYAMVETGDRRACRNIVLTLEFFDNASFMILAVLHPSGR